ncbi:MAG TPA: SPOR domain-containing protein [Gammaproteobacteria bacterium]
MKQIMHLAIVLCVTAVCGVSAALAQSSPFVSGVQAPAWVERSGVLQPLQAGASLATGDRLSTGKDARVILAMPDESTVKLGEQVQFEIRDLQSAQAEQPFRGFLRVLAGAFRYTTLAAGKAKSRQLDIQVGTATIGIRGTDVWGKSGPHQDLVCLIEGKIEITRAGATPVPMQEALSVYTATPKQPADPLSKIEVPKLQVLALETELTQGQGVMQADGKYAAYIYSVRNPAEAERYRKQLRQDGYAAEIYTAEVNDQTWQRVAIPYFATAADARTVGARLEKLYNIDDTWVGKF